MVENIDYSAIDVPDEKHPTEYTCHEKRAEILRLWRESNDPYSELSQTQLAKRYDNAVSTIHNDFEVVKEFIRENIGKDDELKSDLGFDRSIRKLEEQGKWYKAAQVRKMKWEWLQESGHKAKQPDKHELSGPDGGPIEQETTHSADLDDSDYEFLDRVFGDDS